jgi:UDP-N-acetylmuramate dehydrogenase
MIVAEYMDPPAKVPGTQGELRRNADMSSYTSWRAGGKADRLYTPTDLADLCAFLKTLEKEEPVYFIGLGSNLLVRDGGLRGTVIHLHGALRRIDLEQRKTNGSNTASPFGVIFAEAGVASPKVARFAATHDLVGAEFLAGIPGTVGGALAMNAGCYGHETWEFVTQVLTVNRCGDVQRRSPKEYRVSYRHVEREQPPRFAAPRGGVMPALGRPGGEHDVELGGKIAATCNEWFVGAWFMFPRGDGAQARLDIKNLLEKRIASQPLNLPNAGSVFRNPPGDFAARLIEACGLKGAKLGGAQISEKHANFIVNLGHATASDIEGLIDKIQTRVEEKFGLRLIREVRILGEPL